MHKDLKPENVMMASAKGAPIQENRNRQIGRLRLAEKLAVMALPSITKSCRGPACGGRGLWAGADVTTLPRCFVSGEGNWTPNPN